MKWEKVRIVDIIGRQITGEWGTDCVNDNSVRVLRTTNFTNSGDLDFSNVIFRNISDRKIEDKKLINGDIILEKSGGSDNQPVGRVVYFSADDNNTYLCNNFTQVIRVKKDVNSRYVFYYLFYRHILGYTKPLQNKTTGIRNLDVNKYIGQLIPLPPIDTQQKIAEILDKASELIKKRKEQIELLDRFVKSVFIDMFGDPVTNPKGWKECQFEKYISFMTSGSRGWSQYFSDSGNLFLTIKNVKHGRLMLSNVQYVNPPNNKETQRTKVQKEDLLISITADLGRTAVVDKDTAEAGAYINQHLCLLRLDSIEISPIYIAAFLESEGGKVQFRQKDQTGVKSGLNFEAIKSLNILVPPINLQNQFAAIVEQTEKQKELLSSGLKKLELTYKSLMQKAFSGELIN